VRPSLRASVREDSSEVAGGVSCFQGGSYHWCVRTCGQQEKLGPGRVTSDTPEKQHCIGHKCNLHLQWSVCEQEWNLLRDACVVAKGRVITFIIKKRATRGGSRYFRVTTAYLLGDMRSGGHVEALRWHWGARKTGSAPERGLFHCWSAGCLAYRPQRLDMEIVHHRRYKQTALI